MNKKKIYQIPRFQVISAPDIIRTSSPKAPLETSEIGFGDQINF